MSEGDSRARDALAMVGLLNRETRHNPSASAQRQVQRSEGGSGWELRDALVSENLRSLIAPAREVRAPEPGLADYDEVLPMEPASSEEPMLRGVAVSGGIRVLTVRRIG